MSVIPKTVNADLQKERDGATLNVEEFAIWWNRGDKKLKLKRDLEKFVFTGLREDAIAYMTREEVYDTAVRQAIETAKKLRVFQEQYNPGGNEVWPAMFVGREIAGAINAGNPFGVHFSMTLEALKSQGTDEQFERFGKPAANFGISITYAQTELGHGTFLRGLETRADYDRKTQEFVLNTPKLSSYKFWPGGLGHSTNHAIVVAQLYIDDQAKGVHMFVVPIRDQNTHMPLPGIDVGDIGAKMGFHGVNNGFLGLKNVRVPRLNMLMRNSKVEADGSYTKSPASVLTYFAMVFMRCIIAEYNATMVTMAATIATRYSAVRRQSPIDPAKPEVQIIDHVTQQNKLFPEIAVGVAYRFASEYLWDLYDKTTVDIKNGDYSRLPEMHSLSCSLKVLCSYDTSAGIDRLRMACGGHGYLASSNLSNLYSAATAACTYEGENTVLLLQIGRILMKSWAAGLEGLPLPPTLAYLGECAKQTSFGKLTFSYEQIVKALQYASANKTRLAFESLSKRLAAGQSEHDAGNATGIELIEAAELHGRHFVCSTFLQKMFGPEFKTRSAVFNQVLENLMTLFLLRTFQKHLSDILRCIAVPDDLLREVQDRLEGALKSLRPNAVAICDGFDYHDRNLNSTLGAFDGNAYERIMDDAKKRPINQNPVPKSFHSHLKPFLQSNL